MVEGHERVLGIWDAVIIRFDTGFPSSTFNVMLWANFGVRLQDPAKSSKNTGNPIEHLYWIWSRICASIAGNRLKCARFVVAMVTVSAGWPARAAWPARMASASRASGDAVGMPDCRRKAQNSA